MKLLIPIFLIAFLSACGVKKETKKIVEGKGSLSKNEIANMPAGLLDTVYIMGDNGNLKMVITAPNKDESSIKKVPKERFTRTDTSIIDTAYIEDPIKGNIEMILTKQKKAIVRKQINPASYPKHKSGDTVYVEDPITGNINMIIVK